MDACNIETGPSTLLYTDLMMILRWNVYFVLKRPQVILSAPCS